MTTKSKRDRKKINQEKGRIERLAQILDNMDAMAEVSDEELAEVDVKPERPESEKAAAMTALAAVKDMRKKLRRD